MKRMPLNYRQSFVGLAFCIISFSAQSQATINVSWDKSLIILKSIPTLQVVVNPRLRKGSNMYLQSFEALKDLGADYVRYVAWLPYPKLGVPELEPPINNKTSWNFTLIDPITLDFLSATANHPVMLNFSTIPAWMYKTEVKVLYPSNPDNLIWNYSQGNTLYDTTMQQVADYFARIFSWYTKGGFTDELGVYHYSGYHFKIPYWEVLNEPDIEHNYSPEQYTKLYDAVVNAIRKLSPETKFVGLALAFENNPNWFDFFLNYKNHKLGVPLDMISYHFYATNIFGQTIENMQYTYFERADGFIKNVRYIESIRKRLSPNTKTSINEVGTILFNQEDAIPNEYWNLSGALFAYLYIELSKLGIDIIGESQLVGYPTQFPSVSMINWTTGKPNARYWILKLLKDNFELGDSLLQSSIEGMESEDILAQGFKTKKGYKILIINKRNKEIKITLPEIAKGGMLKVVDVSTKDNEPKEFIVDKTLITLQPFTVAVIKLL